MKKIKLCNNVFILQKLQFVTTEVDGTDFANFVSGLYKVYIDDEKKMLSVDNSRFILDPNSGKWRIIFFLNFYDDCDSRMVTVNLFIAHR